MSTRSVAEFESSLADLGVTRTRTTTETFESDLQEAIREPVVGTPVPIEGVSFGDLPITTHPTPAELDAATTGVTAAEFAVAPYGTVVVADTPDGDDPVSLFPDRHVAVVRESDILDSMAAAFGASCTLGALITFLVTLADVPIFGLGAPFWGLVFGCAASWLLERREYRQALSTGPADD